MRLTRRGWATVAVIAVAVGHGWLFGARSLNAVAAPLLLAIVVGAVSVRRTNTPTVDLLGPRPGFPGDARQLELSVGGSGIATVTLSIPDGVTVASVDAVVSVPHVFDRELELRTRGVYTIGPPTVTQRDALGLVERRVEVDSTAEVVIYPQRYEVTNRSPLAREFAEEFEAERQEFDRLREYEPGDPLRRVHWKTSAKRDEFMVVEYAATERDDSVSIAALSDPGQADEMARAVATVAHVAFDTDRTVSLELPDEQLPPGVGQAHHGNLLRLLAETDGGDVSSERRREADIVIDTRGGSMHVQIGDRTTSLWNAISRETATERRESEAETRGRAV